MQLENEGWGCILNISYLFSGEMDVDVVLRLTANLGSSGSGKA